MGIDHIMLSPDTLHLGFGQYLATTMRGMQLAVRPRQSLGSLRCLITDCLSDGPKSSPSNLMQGMYAATLSIDTTASDTPPLLAKTSHWVIQCKG